MTLLKYIAALRVARAILCNMVITGYGYAYYVILLYCKVIGIGWLILATLSMEIGPSLWRTFGFGAAGVWTKKGCQETRAAAVPSPPYSWLRGVGRPHWQQQSWHKEGVQETRDPVASRQAPWQWRSSQGEVPGDTAGIPEPHDDGRRRESGADWDVT